MYLAIDVGGTKTLLASFSSAGKLGKTYKFATSHDYERFKNQLELAVKANFTGERFDMACCAIPGRIDRKEGMALGYGTLRWPPAPIKHALEKILKMPVLVENDAKLAGLFEANQAGDHNQKVLYVTLGTGIGTALIENGRIDEAMADSEGGQIWLDRGGKRTQFEDLVSGRAIYERFGHRAAEITDQDVWRQIVDDLAEGLFSLIAVTQPQLVIIGGGVGAHFAKFGKLLNENLKKMGTALVPIPPVVGAKKAEEAVIYGCFEFIKQTRR